MPQPGAGWAAGSRVGVPAHGGKNGGRSRGPRGEVGLRGEGGHMTPCFRCWLCKHVDASPLTVENGSAQPAAPLPTAPASRPTAGPVGMWLGSALPEGERGMADGGGRRQCLEVPAKVWALLGREETALSRMVTVLLPSLLRVCGYCWTQFGTLGRCRPQASKKMGGGWGQSAGYSHDFGESGSPLHPSSPIPTPVPQSCWCPHFQLWKGPGNGRGNGGNPFPTPSWGPGGGFAQPGGGCQAPIPVLPYGRLLTSRQVCQHPAPSPSPSTGLVGRRVGPLGSQLEPTEGTVPGKGPCGTWRAWLDGARQRTDLPHACWRLGAPVGGEEGKEMRRKFPNCFQGKKLLLRKKMPKRSGCPRPAAAPGGGHTGWFSHGRDGRRGLGRCRTSGTWPCQSRGAPNPRGWAASSGSLAGPWLAEGGWEAPEGRDTGQHCSPPLLQTPGSPSGHWPTSAWVKPCASYARSSTSTRCSTPWRP